MNKSQTVNDYTKQNGSLLGKLCYQRNQKFEFKQNIKIQNLTEQNNDKLDQKYLNPQLNKGLNFQRKKDFVTKVQFTNFIKFSNNQENKKNITGIQQTEKHKCKFNKGILNSQNNQDIQNPQKKNNSQYRFKCFRYLKELQTKYNYSREMALALVRSCKKYKQFKKKFNTIRENFKLNNIQISKVQQNWEIKESLLTTGKNCSLLQQENKNLNLKQQQNVFNLEITQNNQNEDYTNQTENDDSIYKFEEQMFIDDKDIVKQVIIDPEMITGQGLNIQQLKEKIEKIVDINGFCLQDENLQGIIEAAEVYKQTIANNNMFKINDDINIQNSSIINEKNKNLQNLQENKNEEQKQTNQKYCKYEWGHSRITTETIQIQGDITNKQLWQDLQKIQQKYTPNKKYSCILMDPAWTGTGLTLGYKTLKDKSWINSIKLSQLLDNGFLGVWVSNKKLPIGFKYIEHNNFDFIELIVWAKINSFKVIQNKIGFYLLHNVEYCIVGMKRYLVCQFNHLLIVVKVLISYILKYSLLLKNLINNMKYLKK